jgi:ABC-type dipeptide/oligopeptide/nickel transport system ATPase component
MWSDEFLKTDFKDLKIKESEKKYILSWINNLKNIALFITGESGTGKTTIAYSILAKYGFEVRSFDASSFKTVEMLRSCLNNLIINDFSKIFDEKIGVIIENIDLFFSSNIKGLVNELIKLITVANEKGVKNPIIFTSSNFDSKGMKKFMNCVNHLELSKPGPEQIRSLIESIMKKKGIGTIKPYIELLVSKTSNYKNLIDLLQYYKNVYKIEGINTEEKFIEFMDKVQYSKEDQNLNFILKEILFNDKLEIGKQIEYFYTDPLLIPDILYENYPKTVYKRIGTKKKSKFGSLLKISEYMSKSAKYYQEFGPSSITDVSDIYSYYNIVSVHNIIKNCGNKSKTKNEIFVEKSKLFSLDQQILNNIRRIDKFSETLMLTDSEALTIIEYITYYLFEEKDLEKVAALVIRYKIDLNTMLRDILTIAKHKGKNYEKSFTKSIKNSIEAMIEKIG